MLVSTLVRAAVLLWFGIPHIRPLVFDMQNMSSLSSTSKSRIACLAQSIHMVSKASNTYFCPIYHPREMQSSVLGHARAVATVHPRPVFAGRMARRSTLQLPLLRMQRLLPKHESMPYRWFYRVPCQPDVSFFSCLIYMHYILSCTKDECSLSPSMKCCGLFNGSVRHTVLTQESAESILWYP